MVQARAARPYQGAFLAKSRRPTISSSSSSSPYLSIPPHDPQPRQGDEELAREALSRRQQQVEVATSLGEQMTVQAGAINKLFTSMQQLEAKITEAKVRPCVFACR